MTLQGTQRHLVSITGLLVRTKDVWTATNGAQAIEVSCRVNLFGKVDIRSSPTAASTSICPTKLQTTLFWPPKLALRKNNSYARCDGLICVAHLLLLINE